MSCPSCNCNPCQCNCSCDPQNEAVSSALSNLQLNFLGAVTKQCVNGEVVWVLPCNLNTDFSGIARQEGESLLCYWRRVLQALIDQTGICPNVQELCGLANSAGFLSNDGLGNFSWQTAVASGLPVAFISHRTATNVAAGTSNSGSWETRPLDTIEFDPDGIVTALALNRFTLAAGTYRIFWSSIAFRCDGMMTRLYDNTNATELMVGTTHNTSNAVSTSVASTGMARITLAAQADLEIQNQVETGQATYGFGTAVNFGSDQLHAWVHIIKES